MEAGPAEQPLPPWAPALLAEDLNATCSRDLLCVACAAAFCGHCCAQHHQGHDTIQILKGAGGGEQHHPPPPAIAVKDLAKLPPADDGRRLVAKLAGEDYLTARHRRDAFCVDCAGAFSQALCAHHEGHQVVHIVDHGGGRLCMRCTGLEPWFAAFSDIHAYEDEHGHKLIQLRCGRRAGGDGGSEPDPPRKRCCACQQVITID